MNTELDSVTEDAIRDKAPIPPMSLPDDQRRAYLGGVYSRRNGTVECPYIDKGCAAAWHQGYEAEQTTAA